MSVQQHTAFRRLLAWRRRDDLRVSHNAGDVAEARAGLDSARNDVRTTLAGFR